MSTPVSPPHPISRLMLGLIRARGRAGKANSSQQGLTLLECLMAVAVMALTIVAVAPPLVIASATRVQTRRAEQALQVAQAEVDRIRALVVRDDHRRNKLPAVVDVDALRTYVPSTISNLVKSPDQECNIYPGTSLPSRDEAVQVDIDGDCGADFFMQVIRTEGRTSIAEDSGQQRPSGFDLAVRVYSSVAARNPTTNVESENQLNNLRADQASLSLTSGDGRQLTRPLAVLYVNISWSDSDSTLCEYQGDQAENIETCQGVFE
ncbi:MAG: type II secretion system protein [Cyanobacteria bacterium CRU_2_1]|nr:type II secretion system protein [Cyanobacteria bacterium RU_5_0]NJR59095.1 type II secretion system protein [Cyanobacteria bacterium CRU_2_1]